jgi:hypothetical protein
MAVNAASRIGLKTGAADEDNFYYHVVWHNAVLMLAWHYDL